MCPYIPISNDMYTLYFFSIYLLTAEKKKIQFCIWTTTLNQRDWIDNRTNVCERDTNFRAWKHKTREMPTNIRWFFFSQCLYTSGPCSQRSIYIICMHTYHKFCINIYIESCHLPPIKILYTFAKHFLLRDIENSNCHTSTQHPPTVRFFAWSIHSRLCVKKKIEKWKTKNFFSSVQVFRKVSRRSPNHPLACCSHTHTHTYTCRSYAHSCNAQQKSIEKGKKKRGDFFS